SGPFVQSRTKARSNHPRSILTWAIPRASAPSLPGLTRSHAAALLARPARRGSPTISRAPRRRAADAVVAWAIRARLGLYPQNNMQPACSKSGIGVPETPIPTPKVNLVAEMRPQPQSSIDPHWLGLPKARIRRWIHIAESPMAEVEGGAELNTPLCGTGSEAR